MLSDRELQSLRNMGNEAESAADEIEQLRAERDELKARYLGCLKSFQEVSAAHDEARAERDALRARIDGSSDRLVGQHGHMYPAPYDLIGKRVALVPLDD